ncbi:MAG: DUF86 domain-containing protein [Bacteroidaceae bacterium]|nr:DUF86 domain-containing protein [Bacteroidaceae bacterium]
MRERAKDPRRLEHMLEAIDSAFEHVGSRDKAALIADRAHYHGVLYNIAVIGEAANMLTNEFRESHPATPWKQIIGMRNFLIHDYHTASIATCLI